uniref:UBX domain-containing protein 11 isoform X2 n=1 Tax=Tursiops truncatus TaxID=9739 RepID=A0A6J3Q2B8_TURTR|nr:UBX domain-containing protein 11 isoform X2 [Tursiops truncatus]
MRCSPRIRRYGPWRSWWRPSRSTRVRGPLWAGQPPFVPPGPATSGYQGSESIKLSPVVESGQWSPERSSDTQGGALLCGTESPERSPSPALSTGPASQSLEERQPRQEPCSVGWWPPESQGLPSQGQGERPRGASPGIPRVLVEQLLQMTLRPKLLSWPEVAWQPPCGGHRNPSPSFPEGTVTLQRQEELETTCAQLQRQVGEMERFLGDYGLQWVGEPMHEEDSEDGERDWMTAKKFWKPGSRMTAEKFLNRLPKLVIRQGEVIDIRGPIRDTLKIQEIVVETPALAAERERSQESPESPVPALSTLRIKSENGEQAFLLLMRPEDTVGDVRTLLAQARWARGSAGVRSGALAPRPGLIRSSLSPGPWRPPPSRSSVRSRPQSTTMTLSRCRPRAWCPTPRCCFGRAGLRCPPPAPNKAPTPTPAALRGSLGRAAQQH